MLLLWVASAFLAGAGCAQRGAKGLPSKAEMLGRRVVSTSPDGRWSLARVDLSTAAKSEHARGKKALTYLLLDSLGGPVFEVVEIDPDRGWPKIEQAFWSPNATMVACIVRYHRHSDGIILIRHEGTRWNDLNVEEAEDPAHRLAALSSKDRHGQLRGEWLEALRWTGNRSFVADFHADFDSDEGGSITMQSKYIYTVDRYRVRLVSCKDELRGSAGRD
jgi:hypothetical protein